jgi:hypothetical protein
MRRFLIAFVAATVIGAGALAVAHPLNHGTHGLSKQQKQELKAAKRRQHAAKAMSPRKVASAERRRMKHDQASERRILRAEQKKESRSIKQSSKSATRSHPKV